MATLTLIILKQNTSPAPKMTNSKAQYNPQKIEQEAQEYWDINNSFSVTEDKKKEKFYCLSMFPYPSGSAHMLSLIHI